MHEAVGDSLIQCYNKGCGKKFDPSNNDEVACLYHPGPPYFHDAYKIWNCCKKKSTDFGTWLNYAGCTRGLHNGEKPADIVRIAAQTEIRPEKEEEVIVWNGLNKPAKRLGEGVRREVALRVESTEGARAAIQKYKEQVASDSTTELAIGAACRNNSCDQTYRGERVFMEDCVFHPGIAIFHEGMKFWSCCKKKTSDFGAFLDQKGCSTGPHCWSKNEKVDKLREDWFSSNGMITINLYCKGAVPEEVEASSDGQMLRVKVVHGFGSKETQITYDLWGHIEAEESFAIVGERKVELKLKQANNNSWPRLQYDDSAKNAEEEEAKKDTCS